MWGAGRRHRDSVPTLQLCCMRTVAPEEVAEQTATSVLVTTRLLRLCSERLRRPPDQMMSHATGLISLPAELRRHAFSFLSLADHLVQLSMACKLLRREVLDHREPMARHRILACRCSPDDRLNVGDAAAAGACPRVHHAPYAVVQLDLRHRPPSTTLWRPPRAGSAPDAWPLRFVPRRQVLGRRGAPEPAGGYGRAYCSHGGRSACLPPFADGVRQLQPSDGRPGRGRSGDGESDPLAAVSDDAGADSVRKGAQHALRRWPAGSQDSVCQKERPALECSICHFANCLPESHESERCFQCDIMFRCRSCDFTVCSFCEEDLPRKERCNNADCPQWLCDVCEPDILMKCYNCSAHFCAASVTIRHAASTHAMRHPTESPTVRRAGRDTRRSIMVDEKRIHTRATPERCDTIR